jgi:transposase
LVKEYNQGKMPYSSSLTDQEWEIIEPLLPKKKRTKPPTWSKREILDGVLYQLKKGCNWCDLPKDLPLGWKDVKVWSRILKELLLMPLLKLISVLSD